MKLHWLCLSIALTFTLGWPVRSSASALPSASNESEPAIVFGFVGGFVSRADRVHSTVQLAEKLRKDSPPNTAVEVFENHHADGAYPEILKLLDTNHDGTLSQEEKRDARIILYGHSWGAAQVVELARELKRDQIPVLLTIQVDSVPKPGIRDDVIPSNVAEAVNFYQSEGFVHGEPHIYAQDAARTKILGNYRFDYKNHPIECDEYPWYARMFMKEHTEIECDPKVWNQVERLILEKLAAADAPGTTISAG